MKIKAEKALSPFFIKEWPISTDSEFEVEFVEPRQFFRAERLDLVSKLFYIECREKGYDCSFAKELYTEFIRAFSLGSFTEPGTESKNSIEKYFASFDVLIDNVKKTGLSAEQSVVPIGENGSILDGSHRTAIAIYFGIRLPVIRIPGVKKSYDYLYFEDRGMPQRYLDYAIQKYVAYADHCYIACLWPRATGAKRQEAADKLIRETVSVVCKRQIKLNYNGMRQLMIHIYGNQEWAGTFDNGFAGIPVKAKACYHPGVFTTVYVLEGADLESMVQLKSEVRDIFRVENHSVHITDTKEEAVDAAQVLFNEYSVILMNYGDITADRQMGKQMLDESTASQGRCLSLDATKRLFGLIKANQVKTLWQENDHTYAPTDLGCVFGLHFPCLEKCDLSVSERIRYQARCIRYGVVIDFITELQIKRRVRHLGRIILRKIGIIR